MDDEATMNSSQSNAFTELMGPLQSFLFGREEKKRPAISRDADPCHDANPCHDATNEKRKDKLPSSVVIGSTTDTSTSSLISERDISRSIEPPFMVETPPESVVSDNLCYEVSSEVSSSEVTESDDFEATKDDKPFSFLIFRLSYLFVTLVIMLADGLQGKYRGQ